MRDLEYKDTQALPGSSLVHGRTSAATPRASMRTARSATTLIRRAARASPHDVATADGKVRAAAEALLSRGAGLKVGSRTANARRL